MLDWRLAVCSIVLWIETNDVASGNRVPATLTLGNHEVIFDPDTLACQ